MGNKIAVKGASGAGKTTLSAELARRLGVPHIELDALHHGPNWSEPSAEEFRVRVRGSGDLCPRTYVRSILGGMSEPEVFVLADRALNKVVAQIKDEQWQMQMPPTFATRVTDHPPTLYEIINYHAYDDSWVPDMLAGKTMEEAGKDNFAGDLLGDDPKASFAAIVETACAAARALDDPERVVHCSFGDFPAREYLWQINTFRGLRAHDIAKVIGVDPTLPDDLVQGLWDEISPHADEWRQYGVFPPAVPVPDTAPLMDRLLGITGRDPKNP